MKVWLDGEIADEQVVAIGPSDRGFLLGDGVFDTLKLMAGRPVFLTAHLERLTHATSVLGFSLPFDASALTAAIRDLAEANGLKSEALGSMRITATRGSGPRGLAPPADPSPRTLITCAIATPPPLETSAIIATGRRNELSPTANVKTLTYLDQVMAKREAIEAGATDALLLNTKGKLACATAANLFVWDSNMLLTPRLEDGCLPGIMRQAVMEAASAIGLSVFEETIEPHTALSASGAFLSNSLVGLQELISIDEKDLERHPRLPDLRAAVAAAEIKSLQIK